MNAPAKIETPPSEAPILSEAKPCLDWRVVIFGGKCPRRGFDFEPLEFCYPRSNSEAQVRAKVRDKASAQFRTHYAIMAPATYAELAARSAAIDAALAGRLAA